MVLQADGAAHGISAARTQSLFRAINDELGGAGHSDDSTEVTIACECADRDCVETIDVEIGEYGRVRRQATHFIVLRGHVYPDVERVVEENSRFVVVEKIGEAAHVAAALGSGQ